MKSHAQARIVALILATLASAVGPYAYSADPPRTCLVLGGGGARGAAHIGVLKVLERERVPIDCVVGTSMGAIVGGLYAAGYKADEIEYALKSIDWGDVFDDDPSRSERSMRRKEDDLRFLGGVEVGLREGEVALPQGVVQGQKLLLILRRLLLSTWNVRDFDDLPLPFRAVAANIVTGEKVVFAEGDLAIGIRASMSVPGAFAPIRVDGRLLVDGGMVDNVPVDEGRKLGAERLIVVAVGSPMKEEAELGSPFAIADQMVTALMKVRTDEQIATLREQDLLITPALGKFSASDFSEAQAAIDIGFAAADESTAAIRRYAVDEQRYAQFAARHRARPFDPPLIEFLEVPGEYSRTAQYVEQRLARNVGKQLDLQRLERDLGVAYGEGPYELIQWDLQERDGQTGLQITPRDKAWGPDFMHFGLRLSDDFDGRSSYQLLGELKFTGVNSLGGEARFGVQIGRLLNAHAEFYQPWGKTGRWSIAPYLDYRAFDVPIRESLTSDVYLAEILRTELVGGLAFGFQPDNHWRLSAALEVGKDGGRVQIGTPPPTEGFADDLARIRPRIEYDSLDSAAFPSRGLRFDLSEELYLEDLGSDQEANVTRLHVDFATSLDRHHLLLGVKAAQADGGEDLIGTFSTLGGLTNLSGYTDNELIVRQLALGRAIYYRRLTDADRLVSFPLYAGVSAELGGVWADRDDIDSDDLITAGSVFVGLDTVLGPIFFGYGRTEDDIDSFYLRFGPMLRADTRF